MNIAAQHILKTIDKKGDAKYKYYSSFFKALQINLFANASNYFNTNERFLMKKVGNIILAMSLISFFFISSAFAGEKDVLKALEKINGAIEVNTSYNNYCDLLADAKVEINIYGRKKTRNECFFNAVNECFKNYEAFKTHWRNLMDAEVKIPKTKATLREHGDNEEIAALAGFLLKLNNALKKEAEVVMPKALEGASTQLDKAYRCMD